MSRRGENIYKRRDNRWEGRTVIGYDNAGKKKYHSVYAKSYTEVKQKKREFENTRTSKVTLDQIITFGHIAELWLSKQQCQIKRSTYSTYQRMLKSQFLPQLADVPLANFNDNFIQIFLMEKLQNGRVDGKGGLARKSVRDIQMLLGNILQYAQKEYQCAEFYSKSKPIKVAKVSVQVLNQQEQHIMAYYLIQHLEENTIGILLSMYTGIRLGEACALKWGDICFQDSTLKVCKTALRIQNEDHSEKFRTKLIVDSPKSTASIRDIPIPGFLNEPLQKLSEGYSKEAYILTGSEEKCMDPRTYQKLFKRCLKNCELRDMKYHCLRHSFATICISLGFDVKTLSEILGHASVQITLDRYVHSSMETKHRQMDKLMQFAGVI